MKRRDFIKHLPIGVAATAVPFSLGGLNAVAFGRNSALDKLLNTQSLNDRVLVLINLGGGNDGLNTVVPFQDPLYYNTYRPKIGFSTASDRDMLKKTLLRGDLALSPMAQFTDTQNSRSSKLYDLWKDGKLAVIQNVGYDDSNRSHFRSTDIWNTASDSNIIISTGWLGRYLEHERPDYPFDVVSGEDPLAISVDYAASLAFQGNRSMMGIAVNDPYNYNAAANYADDMPPANHYGDELGFIRNILVQSDIYGKRIKEKFPSGESPQNNVVYPAGNPLAQQLRKVAWCIAKGMTTKVYFTAQYGYDTHVQQNSKDNQAGHGRLIFELAEAISLFQEDLEKFGVADRVIGMTYSEFGRRVNENGSDGTDHGTCAPQFIFGTNVNGELYGNHPNLGTLDMYADLIHQFDFRQLYAGVLTNWFGASADIRKSVLNSPQVSSRNDFTFEFPVNGSGTMQPIIKPQSGTSETLQVSRFKLEQNYPNPVVSETVIPFALSETADVVLEIFDSRGERVATPVKARLGRGEHPITFDARRLASGKYFYRLDVNGIAETKQFTVVR